MRRKWTEHEIEYIKAHYKKMTIRQIAEALGRSATGVEAYIMRMGLQKGTNSGHFKKGARGPRWVPIGTISKKTNGIWNRKVAENEWKPIHHLLWEVVYGPIPRGHMIAFIDGNTSNIRITNLELLTHAEMMERNSHLNYPPEVQEIIRLKGLLTTSIRGHYHHGKQK